MAKTPKNAGFDAEAVAKLLNKAKKMGTPLPFAFGLASKPEDCGLVLHLRKPSRVLREEVKAMPAVKKTCHGTVTVEKGLVLFQSEKPIKGMIKALKKVFRDEGLGKYRPVLADSDGAEILDDDDKITDSEATAPVPATAEPAEPVETSTEPAKVPDSTEIKKRFVAAVAAAKKLPAKKANVVNGALKSAAADLKSNALTDCAAKLTKIESVLSATPPASPVAEKLKRALALQIKSIQQLPDPSPAHALAKEMNGLLKEGDLKGAAEAYKALVTRIAEQQQITATENPMDIWQKAKGDIDASVSKLQSALKGFDDPTLNRIADLGLNGATDGNNSALMKALFDLQRAPGGAKSKAASALVTQLATYKKFLDDDPVIELIENNPLGIEVPVRKILFPALGKIAKIAKAA